MPKLGNFQKIIVAYVPVLHEGYRRFFEESKSKGADTLYLLGPDIIKEYKSLSKDIRALPPEIMGKAVKSLGYFEKVKVVGVNELKKIDNSRTHIYLPDEVVMRELAEKLFPLAMVKYNPIFLRWDKHKSFEQKPVEADQIISQEAFDLKVIELLRKESVKSLDFWRQIGGAVIKDGEVLLMTHNKAVPDEHLHYTEGDPRSDFSKGVNVELSLFFHCEAQMIAEAARKGISLEGASMYVTTFPCPPCAKLVAYSGIKKLYYSDGYGVLDGERVLKSRGVKIIFVKTK